MIAKSAMQLILWQTLATFLLIGALAGIVVSLLLVYRPAQFASINRAASRWISTRRVGHMVDRMLDCEQWFYRHHRALGILICLGAGYLLVHFGLLFDRTAALQQFPAHFPVRVSLHMMESMLDALVLSVLTGATVALLVGLALWLRPSALRGLDEASNQWVSLRRHTRFLDVPHDHVGEFVQRHTQRVGWLLLLGSILLLLLVLRALIY